MSNSISEVLNKLILSLSKAEKRSFKLFAKRNSSNSEELKFLLLFDFLEKYPDASDAEIVKKNPQIKKVQLANLKSHLIKQLMTSIRLNSSNKIISFEVNEYMENAELLYMRGLYLQALKLLEKAKVLADKLDNSIQSLLILEKIKFIESQYVTRSFDERADELSAESISIEKRVSSLVQLSNLSLQLYSLYLKVGFVRDEKDFMFVQEFFNSRLPKVNLKEIGFNEKFHLYSAYFRYYYIQQDFVMCYKYAQKTVELFKANDFQAEQNKELFFKSIHNLILVLFYLRSYKRMQATFDYFVGLKPSEKESENIQLLHQQYEYTNYFNLLFLQGKYSDGLKRVPEIISFLNDSESKLDTHRIIVLYYKIACLHFGVGQFKKAVKYLDMVLSLKNQSLREDILCFSHILNLICHYELGNDQLVEYQLKSVYRYLSKIGNLQGVQQEVLNYIRTVPTIKPTEINKSFKQLLSRLRKLSESKFERRPFMYLDIIAWLESKIDNKSIEQVASEKFILEMKSGESNYLPKSN